MQHDYADALHKSLLFYRAQRSGDLSGTANPIPWRQQPSFLKDGADVGVDLSKGYFDAGDYVKYGQPAAYTVSMLAWSGVLFAEPLRAAGAMDELKSAVRWGSDYILQASRHIEHGCTFHAQVGRGAAMHCSRDACKYDHGYWGRPEDYERDFTYASQRRTYSINSTNPGIEIWASASAALSAAHMLLRDDGGRSDGGPSSAGSSSSLDADAVLYAAELLVVSKALYGCAADPSHNRGDAFLQHAGLPEVAPQYASFGFSDELGWASAWLYDATKDAGYLAAFQQLMRRGEDRCECAARAMLLHVARTSAPLPSPLASSLSFPRQGTMRASLPLGTTSTPSPSSRSS